AGVGGMVTGQVLDMTASHNTPTLADVVRLQRLKTGALIEFSCLAGPILTDAPAGARHALSAYSHDIGLAFQIADDLLDEESTEEQIGKPVHADAAQRKATFITVMGLERARSEADALARRAAAHLDFFGERAGLLKALARHIVERSACCGCHPYPLLSRYKPALPHDRRSKTEQSKTPLLDRVKAPPDLRQPHTPPCAP